LEESLYRIVDANLNRAREGLRVLEELVRFYFEDLRLTARCREMRHTLARYAENIPGGYTALLAGREAARDVGSASWPGEGVRAGLAQLVAANCKRTQEALRVLEEYAKVLHWPADGLKALRFASYELEKSIMSLTESGCRRGERVRRGRRRRPVTPGFPVPFRRVGVKRRGVKDDPTD